MSNYIEIFKSTAGSTTLRMLTDFDGVQYEYTHVDANGWTDLQVDSLKRGEFNHGVIKGVRMYATIAEELTQCWRECELAHAKYIIEMTAQA